MIRFILVCIVVIAYLVLTIPVLLVEWIIGKFSPMTKDISSLRMVQAIFKFILWITGAKVTVIGEENVPKDQAVLYVANHRSYFDILLTYSRCPIRTGYVAKKEMEHYPLLSNWMRNLYCLFLDREDIKQGLKTILQAADYVKSGISVCIFRKEPEIRMLMKQKCCLSMTAASRSQPEPKARSFLLRSATLPISGRPISRR